MYSTLKMSAAAAAVSLAFAANAAMADCPPPPGALPVSALRAAPPGPLNELCLMTRTQQANVCQTAHARLLLQWARDAQAYAATVLTWQQQTDAYSQCVRHGVDAQIMALTKMPGQ